MNNRTRLFWLLGGLALLAVIALVFSPTVQHLAGAALNIPTVTCDQISQIPAGECAALKALYDSTQGANWGNAGNWFMTTTPCDGWFGVACQNQGVSNNIVSLRLGGNQLKGSLPTELGQLTELKILELNGNQLSGALPVSLGALSKLETLDLSYNQLTGSLPPEIINLPALKFLRLQANQLSGALPGSPTLSGEQPSLGGASSLEELSLQYNQFSGSIPAGWDKYSRLKSLYLQMNQLSGPIPPELANLAALENIDLSSNQFSGALPADLGKLKGLKILYLGSNQLSGSIPAALSGMNALQDFGLQSNQITGTIPSELSSLVNLRYLNLSNNRLQGGIPASFANLNKLQQLIVSGNLLTADLPPELGNIATLTTLDVGKNALPGEIPPALVGVVSAGSGMSDYVSFGYNMLDASDPQLVEKLNAKDKNWQRTQTLPPDNLAAQQGPNGKVTLTWTPIAYTADGGFYEISYATSENGPYTVAGVTVDKSSATFDVTGLTIGTLYFFRVRTHTPPHLDQQNALWSVYTTPISVIAINKETPEQQKFYLPIIRR